MVWKGPGPGPFPLNAQGAKRFYLDSKKKSQENSRSKAFDLSSENVKTLDAPCDVFFRAHRTRRREERRAILSRTTSPKKPASIHAHPRQRFDPQKIFFREEFGDGEAGSQGFASEFFFAPQPFLRTATRIFL
ncbi:MAG: hypothetical protein IT572_06120 [Deltaproteobacteria bacterium]|nr:hypothetical protein [Deltaproteobacteria bacterium]